MSALFSSLSILSESESFVKTEFESWAASKRYTVCMSPEDPTPPLDRFEFERDSMLERLVELRARGEAANNQKVVSKISRLNALVQNAKGISDLMLINNALSMLELLAPPKQ